MTTFLRLVALFLALVASVYADVSFEKGKQYRKNTSTRTSTSTDATSTTPFDGQDTPFAFDPKHYDPTLMNEYQLGLYSELETFHHMFAGDTRRLLSDVGDVGDDPLGDEDARLHEYLQAAAAANEMHRQLDLSFTREPTAAPVAPVAPTKRPTSRPTKRPTLRPTKRPTSPPTKRPTRAPTPTRPTTPAPTTIAPPQCGTIKTKDGRNLTLGPYVNRDFTCSGGTYWNSMIYTIFDYPTYKYRLRVNDACKYQVKTPEMNGKDKILNDPNSYWEQASILMARDGHKAYKASSDDFIFSSLAAPASSDVTVLSNRTSPDECPEHYCVKVDGKAVGMAPNSNTGSRSPALVYAFSDTSAGAKFRIYLSWAGRSRKKIFMTNHFKRCGCESYCFDRTDVADAEATCYEEIISGERTFQIAYPDGTPDEAKVSWAKTGTTKVMDWFGACASAMFGCKQHKSFTGSASNGFYGTRPNSNYKLPRTFSYSSYKGESNCYGFGGNYKQGYYTYPTNVPRMLWSCPSEQRKDDLAKFGESIGKTMFMYDRGKDVLPTVPSPKEVFLQPHSPNLPPPVGPKCSDVDHNGYCEQVTGGTCYTREQNTTCSQMDFVFQNATHTSAYGDADEWFRVCVTQGTFCEGTYTEAKKLKLLYNGLPGVFSLYANGYWSLYMSKANRGGRPTASGPERSNYFKCKDADGAYEALEMVRSMESRKRLNIKPGVCTSKPSSQPSPSPSFSVSPTSIPSMSPTVCKDSYLTSESLNINLAIDLSYSTYEKTFSSSVNIGDVNGDGKGNTILDAQVVAIEELLKSIAESATLDNDNCEIHLVSFETDAIDHGTWKPLRTHGGVNTKLITYIKEELRAPTSDTDIYNTNNGFTNFDAALDLSVAYFSKKATKGRNNLLVFLSDGEPNVRGDGDNELYCTDTANVWFESGTVQCADMNLAPGQRHTICRGNDSKCVPEEKFQDCVRGPNNCKNSAAATQYDSEINALTKLNVERLAIGVGDESNVQKGSALWMIDNNPAKDLGVLPIQAMSLEELSSALKNLCILNTDPPTAAPSETPSLAPTVSPAPSNAPTTMPSVSPTDVPSAAPSEGTNFIIRTPDPTSVPSGSPSTVPSSNPTGSPSASPTTLAPTLVPSAGPTGSPSTPPTGDPSTPPSESPSGSFFPSSAPTDSPTKSPAPSAGPTELPSGSPTRVPTVSPTAKPTSLPTSNPTAKPTQTPTVSPTFSPTVSSHPTFLLPDCYDDEPKLIRKYSSEMSICFYNPDMIQITDMNTNNVTVMVTNVWTQRATPESVRAFAHSNGVKSVQGSGDGFDCLDEDGQALSIVTEDNSVTMDCFQEAPGEPWLAVMDLVISDSNIVEHTIPHPCNAEHATIDNSCSWRVVVPCDTEDLCSADPSTSPSVAPSGAPITPPTGSPSFGPTSSPTWYPTVFSTTTTPATTVAPGIDDGAVDPSHAPTLEDTGVGNGVACPSDIIVVSSEGTTPFPRDAIRIVSQDTGHVTVALQQTFGSSGNNGTIDTMYYQYQKDHFNQMCYELTNVPASSSKEITIQCSVGGMSLLEVWVADALEHNLLSASDKAVVPECCHPTNPEGTPAIKHTVEIRCVTSCGDQVLQD